MRSAFARLRPSAALAITWLSTSALASCPFANLSAIPWSGLPPDGGAGAAVAIRGSTVAIGVPKAPHPYFWEGEVRVHQLDASGSPQSVATLAAPDSALFDRFGSAVAATVEGLAIGAPHRDGTVADAGAVYHFVESDGAWSVDAILTDSSATPGARLGVAVASDGDVIAATASGALAGGTAAEDGAVVVFRRTRTGWLAEATLVAADGPANRRFGASLAVSGNLIAVGAPLDDHVALDCGAVYLFECVDGLWSQVAKVAAPEETAPGARFGAALAFGGDRILVGAPFDDGPTPGVGRVHSIEGDSGAWKVAASVAPPAGAGCGRALAAMGDSAIVGGIEAIWVLQPIGDGLVFTGSVVAGTEGGGSSGFGSVLAYRSGLVAAGDPLRWTPSGLTGMAWIGALDLQPAHDCDGDGIDDACAVALDLAKSCDPDSQPDICQIAENPALDCDGNGVLDRCDIESASGAGDCDGDHAFDWCQIAAQPELDCNGNGLLDACEIAAGAGADCDLDGVLDACTIAAAPWLDCDGDGALEACTTTYAWFDIDPFPSVWLGSPGGELLWIVAFQIKAGGTLVAALEVAWRCWQDTEQIAFLPPGTPFTALLYADPNDDLDPSDAVILAAVDGKVAALGVNELQTVPMGAVEVGEVGQWFYAGVLVDHPTEEAGTRFGWGVICTDGDEPPSGLQWMASWSTGGGDPSQVAALEPVTSGGDMLLRVVSSFPFDPSVVADLDCSEIVDADDLALLLAAWGPCPSSSPCLGDLDRDADVDAADLGALLAGWTPRATP